MYVGGFLFMDKFEHRAFAEEEYLVDHLLGYEDRFGKLPPFVVMEAKYGTQENRDLMEELEVRASLNAGVAGRKPQIPKTVGLSKNRNNATGSKAVLATAKNIMASIKSNTPSRMALRYG